MVAPITRENCRLTVQCWDQDIFSGDDMVGKCVLNLYSAIRKAFATGAPVQYYDSLKAGDRVSIAPSKDEVVKARGGRKGGVAKLKRVLGTVRKDNENGSFHVDYDKGAAPFDSAPARSILDVVRSSATAALRGYTAIRKAVGGQGQVSSVARYRLKRLPERYQHHEHAQLGLGPPRAVSSPANATASLLLARKPKHAKFDRERKLRAFRRGGRGAALQAAAIAHDAAAASVTMAEAVATATYGSEGGSEAPLVARTRDKHHSMCADGSGIELKSVQRTRCKTKGRAGVGASLREPLLDGASYGYGSMDEDDNYDDAHSSAWDLKSISHRCEPAWLVRLRQARMQRAKEARRERAVTSALVAKRRRKHDEAMKQGGDGSTNANVQKLKRALGLDAKDLPPANSAWVPIHYTDAKTGAFLPAGELCIMVRVVPLSFANITRSGLGRGEPNVEPAMPPPIGRLEFSFNPFFLLRELCGKQRCHSFQAICCCFFVLIFFVFIAGYFNNIVDFFHNVGSIF
jgi:hypothetical protein